jgi:hypothetical protein
MWKDYEVDEFGAEATRGCNPKPDDEDFDWPDTLGITYREHSKPEEGTLPKVGNHEKRVVITVCYYERGKLGRSSVALMRWSDLRSRVGGQERPRFGYDKAAEDAVG